MVIFHSYVSLPEGKWKLFRKRGQFQVSHWSLVKNQIGIQFGEIVSLEKSRQVTWPSGRIAYSRPFRAIQKNLGIEGPKCYLVAGEYM
jgi:hypothetical protein